MTALDLRLKGRRDPQNVGNLTLLDGPWAQPDGSLVLTSPEQAYANAGRVFVVNAGTGTTPITFGAGTIDTTEPDLDLEVPLGAQVKVVLLEIHIQMEAFGSDALFEGMAAVGLGGVFGTTGGTAITPANARTDRPYNSVCRAIGNVDASAATYMTSNVFEIFRFGLEKVATVGTGDDDSNRLGNSYTWSARQSGVYPYLIANGAVARLNVFASGQAGTGFIRCVYAELPNV